MKPIFITLVLFLGLLPIAGCSGGTVSIQLGDEEIATVTSTPGAQPNSELSAQTLPFRQTPGQPVQKAPAPLFIGSNPGRYFVQTRDGSFLNVHASNSTQSVVIGSLPNKTSVIVTQSDRDGVWYKILAAGGIKGWASAQFLIEEVGANHIPSSSQSSATLRVRTLDGDPINIRPQPNSEGKVLGSASNGSYVIYHNTVGQWTEITTPTGVRGYVISLYLVSN